MVTDAIATLAIEEENGSTIESITNKVNASADPPYKFTTHQILKFVKKGMGSAKILRVGTRCYTSCTPLSHSVERKMYFFA